MPSSESESSKASADSDSDSESSIPQGPVKSLWNGSLDDADEEDQEFECVMYWDEEQGCLVKGVRFKDAPFNDYKSLCGTYDWVWDGYPDRDEQVHSYDGSITLELEAHADNHELAHIHGTITSGDYKGTYKGFKKRPSVHHNYFDILNPIDWHDTRTDLEPSPDEVHSFALAQVNDESGHPFVIYYFDSGSYEGHSSFGRWGIVGKKRQGAKYATLTRKEALLLGIGSTRSALMKRAGVIPNRKLRDCDLWYPYGGDDYPKHWEKSERQVVCGVKLLGAEERDLSTLSASYTLFWYNGGISGDCMLSTDDPQETGDSNSFGVVTFSISTSTEGTLVGGFVNASNSLEDTTDSLEDSISPMEDSINLKLEFRGVTPHTYHPSFFNLNVVARRKDGGVGEGDSDDEDGELVQYCVAWSAAQDDNGNPFIVFCVHQDEPVVFIGKKDSEGSKFDLSEAEKRILGIGCSKREVKEINGMPKPTPPLQEKKRQMPQGAGSSQGASKKAKIDSVDNSGGRQNDRKKKGKGKGKGGKK